MMIITNCKEQAVKKAKSLADNQALRVYETLTGKYIISDQEQVQDYPEIDFRHLSVKGLAKALDLDEDY